MLPMNSLLYSNDEKTSLQHYCRMLLEKKRKQVVEESIEQVADTVTIPSAPKARVRFALPFPATAPISSQFFLTEITFIPLSAINSQSQSSSPRCNLCLGSNQSYVMAFMRGFVNRYSRGYHQVSACAFCRTSQYSGGTASSTQTLLFSSASISSSK